MNYYDYASYKTNNFIGLTKIDDEFAHEMQLEISGIWSWKKELLEISNIIFGVIFFYL